ncbi:glycoside hydrolase family 97 protein [Chitinophagaceae bacterium LB-8]|uniref:Glycoside hydrolase family 97 protein n=1 Tax=Paraflavisolibacter caeni TaxID=2982496 RepID=A0A9X2Y148_9BACT|nr:glycoside hydrolase family 97 protein [Paraflavisolibacter caeni]MCU7552557.1 glycoside hydrolase family 97 protein [Paraflavisolibacter caeni]
MISKLFFFRQMSFLIMVSFLALKAGAQDSLSVSSPDGKTVFQLQFNEKGGLSYQLSYTGQPVILKSDLGVEGWQNSFVLKRVERSRHDSSWKPVYGERALINDKYNGATFVLWRNNQERQQMNLEVRAYNEGIGFRYFFTEYPDGGMDVSIGKELTEFTLPAETKAWFTDHAQGVYSLLPLQNWPGEAERPLTLQLKSGLFAVLAEAQVVDYCRTKFMLHPSKANTIATAMYDRVDLTTPFATPWRVIMVAEKATQLLQNNDIILNLNPPCAIENTGWIKPGKIMREVTLSTAGSKELVDVAVKRHLQYIHFDAGWYGYEYVTASDASAVNVDPRRNPKNDLDLQEVIRYAKQRGIGVFLYVNQRALAKQLDQLLPLYQKWGVAGLKFGFVHVGSQQWTTWLHDAVKKCARYNLMVDIHDEYRPTGFSRTYPNLLTQEGVRGNEEMPEANNNAALPFTRFLCGAADYTVCYYHRPSLKKRLAETQNARVLKTTSMHQMALSVVYYSPLQFMYWYDKPEDVQDEPELEFFDHVPTVWDDTKVLDGEIGKYITIARRSGKEWFVGTITNNDARDTKINCSFLTPGKKYQATIYYDDPASPVRTRVSMKKMNVNSLSKLDAKLLPSGGQAIWIRPI